MPTLLETMGLLGLSDEDASQRLHALYSVYLRTHPIDFESLPVPAAVVGPAVAPAAEALERLLSATDLENRAQVGQLLMALNWLRDVPDSSPIEKEMLQSVAGTVASRLRDKESPIWDTTLLGDAPLSAKWDVALTRNVAPTGGSLITTATAEVEITRLKSAGTTAYQAARQHLARVLDPRGWQDLSDAFLLTREVRTDTAGNPLRTPSGDPDLIEPPADLGSSWEGILYEDVLFATVGRFANFLPVSFDNNSDREMVAHYNLWESLWSIAWPGYQPGGIEVDWGELRATAHADSNKITVRSEKNVRFRDRTEDDLPLGLPDAGLWLNYWAPTILMWAAELMAYDTSWTGLP